MNRGSKIAIGVSALIVVGVGTKLATPPAIVECDVGIYCDRYGLIVQRDPDGSPNGGDTAQREGWYWFGVWLSQHTPGVQPWHPKRKLNFDQVLDLLEKDRNGVIYRHPFQEPWNHPYDKEHGTSRDQLVPLIAAMGVWGKTDRLRRLWEALPEDLTGKHAFNGNWRNFLGQDGWDCTKEKQRSCSPNMSCSPPQDTRECTLSTDDRSCSANESTTDCSLHVDTRDCSACLLSLGGHCVQSGNDPICEASKKAQNILYQGDKARCEAAKEMTNVSTSFRDKQLCEAAKAGQNLIYAENKGVCEATKAAINVHYDELKGMCEVAKTSTKYGCETYKQAVFQMCKISNVFSGDLLGPEYINLFMRAMGRNPAVPQIDLFLSPTILKNSIDGDVELLSNTNIRLVAAAKDKDDVGPDLNHIVALVMSEIRYPNSISGTAVVEFATLRPPSYGSYLDRYYATFGHDPANMKDRIDAGISQGWQPEVCATFGAVKWYHREEVGANPGLAAMYGPVLKRYLDCGWSAPAFLVEPADALAQYQKNHPQGSPPRKRLEVKKSSRRSRRHARAIEPRILRRREPTAKQAPTPNWPGERG